MKNGLLLDCLDCLGLETRPQNVAVWLGSRRLKDSCKCPCTTIRTIIFSKPDLSLICGAQSTVAKVPYS